MISAIVVDSSPLGLLTQRRGVVEANACKRWLGSCTSRGLRIIVPEIVDYELRREPIRSRKASSIARLDRFTSLPSVQFIPVSTVSLRRAAELWALARQAGMPTADRHALDIDAILSAQVLSTGLSASDFVVATSNVAHLSRFVTPQLWTTIKL